MRRSWPCVKGCGRSIRLGSGNGQLDGGLNAADPPSRLDASQAAQAENVWFDAGALRRRPGFAALEALGTDAAIDTLHDDGSGRILLQSASKLYVYDPDPGDLDAFYTLTIPEGAQKAPKGSFLPYNDGWVYFINGVEYIRWDGSSAETVQPTAPTYRVYRGNDVTGTPIEEHAPNLLTPRVTIEYRLSQSTSVTRLYLPPEVRTDTDPVAVYCNGSAITGAHISSGILELGTSYSGMGTTFQVVIELKSLFLPTDTDIRACVCAADYGPEGRVFLCGNGTNKLYASAAFDPAYFPADCVQAFGPGEALTGLGKLYGTLIVFRAHAMAEVDLGGSGFRLLTVNPVLGCDMPGTICTLGNRLVWANSYAGMHMLVSTSRETERNVQNISRNIDPLLLSESAEALAKAVCVDYGGRCWLGVGTHVYVWDCTARPYTASGGAEKCAWYFFTGIAAEHWFVHGGSLYFVVRGSDALRRFEARGDDAGQRFAAFWRTGMLDGGQPGRFKHLDRLRLTLLRDEPSHFSVTCRCDELEESCPQLPPVAVKAAASETGSTQTVGCILRRRGVVAFSLEFACLDTASGMAIADVEADCRRAARIIRF